MSEHREPSAREFYERALKNRGECPWLRDESVQCPCRFDPACTELLNPDMDPVFFAIGITKFKQKHDL